MGRFLRRWLGLGVLLGSGANAGCQTLAAVPDTAVRAESVWMPHLRGPGDAAADPTRYRGTLFTLRTSDVSLQDAEWTRCPLEVPYRFESLAPTTVRVDIGDAKTLRRFFPTAHARLQPFLETGRHLHVSYVVTGRFVIDVASPRAASIVCPAASHHVRTIVVGAYQVAVGARVEPREHGPPVASGDVRVDTRGRPAACRVGESAVPVAGCTVPLAFELARLAGHRPSPEVPAGQRADRGALPSESTMPGALERPDDTLVTVGFASCFAGFQPTGDAKRDMQRLTDQCGRPTGMVPHSELIAGWQAAAAEVARYEVPVEPGQCYRAFGVAGEGVRDLDMGLYDPAGRLVARDVRPDAWAVVSSDGPVCVPEEGGPYELVVSVEAGQGTFAVQVWRVER